jgi:hypothetical protein
MERPRNGYFDINSFGAVANGPGPATGPIQRAIDACGEAGGGVVMVPPGRYVSGALFLRSDVHVYLSAGAILTASQHPADFPPIDGRWEGIEQRTHSSLITGIDLHNVSVSGRGLLDGQGMPWWAMADATRKLRILRGLPREAPNPPEAPLRWPRPRVINLVRCRQATLSDFTIRDPPAWSVHLLYCTDATVEGIAIAGLQASNCCGIILDSCRGVRVAGCLIAAGADCLGIKAGYNEDGRRVGIPCEDITVTNCNLTFPAGSGVAIGSETAAGIRNIAINNCVITNCKTGITIRSTRGRGGVIEMVSVSDLVLDRLTSAALWITKYFDSVREGIINPGEPPPLPNPETDRTRTLPIGEGTPTLRDIDISNLTIGEVPSVGIVEGLPERFIERLQVRDIRAPLVKTGLTLIRARHVRLSGLAIEPIDRPAVTAQHVHGLEVHRLRCSRPTARLPLVQFEQVVGAYVHGCDVAPGGAELVRLEGEGNRRIALGANNPIDSTPVI